MFWPELLQDCKSSRERFSILGLFFFFLVCFFFWPCRAVCGILVHPDQVYRPQPLQWSHGNLTTGPPGKSQGLYFYRRSKELGLGGVAEQRAASDSRWRVVFLWGQLIFKRGHDEGASNACSVSSGWVWVKSSGGWEAVNNLAKTS